MTLFETLIVAHVIGDWLLQTEWQAANKETHWGALFAHVVVYHVLMAAIVLYAFDLNTVWVISAVAGLGVFHAVLDRRRFTEWYMRVMRMAVTNDPAPWLRVAVDQALHFVSLAAATVILQRFGAL